MTTENNVAAQAGDEPMDYATQLRAAVETVCEGWTLPPGARKTLEAALWATQVSPRATADVERDAARFRLAIALDDNAEALYAAVMCNSDTDMIRQVFDAAIATTKPGA